MAELIPHLLPRPQIQTRTEEEEDREGRGRGGGGGRGRGQGRKKKRRRTRTRTEEEEEETLFSSFEKFTRNGSSVSSCGLMGHHAIQRPVHKYLTNDILGLK